MCKACAAGGASYQNRQGKRLSSYQSERRLPGGLARALPDDFRQIHEPWIYRFALCRRLPNLRDRVMGHDGAHYLWSVSSCPCLVGAIQFYQLLQVQERRAFIRVTEG